ncbi:hypothetical protein [Phytopseudomonas dryadis]|uniref:Uncharacterized protein n=1 Tax=Phytopseudomonas dryadis TaxID=2487520 RepID=A0A4Q9QVY4_9GAMM|nr:hypothetical protein [Pseudomonas dryadis]TBU87019.1 hypothetical protein DNK44_21540 [Pseudomonas dryadis]
MPQASYTWGRQRVAPACGKAEDDGKRGPWHGLFAFADCNRLGGHTESTNPDASAMSARLENDVSVYNLDLTLILVLVTVLFTVLPIILMRSL